MSHQEPASKGSCRRKQSRKNHQISIAGESNSSIGYITGTPTVGSPVEYNSKSATKSNGNDDYTASPAVDPCACRFCMFHDPAYEAKGFCPNCDECKDMCDCMACGPCLAKAPEVGGLCDSCKAGSCKKST